jgi:hypothetical protein
VKSFVNQHSIIEKALHNLAFSSWSPLIPLSNIETRVFRSNLADIEIKKPVFITALPRAGTTLLLELCVGTKEFASHIYGDMPFLLTPLFWSSFSKLFRHSAPPQERVHGDRILVNVDSPEAFEEIIWRDFWPSRYRKDRLIPWSDSVSSYPDFERFMHDHIRKIILLRGGTASPQVRYISKNNLNIARVGYLKRIFPDSIIVIPFRAPLQHASSLLRQHRSFLKIHDGDPFARKYMEDTGHYDFGRNLRPVDFDDWLGREQGLDPTKLEFWLQYWVSSYRYLLTNASDQIKFISYDALCDEPEQRLRQFGELLEIRNIEAFMVNAKRIAAPKPYDVDINGISSDIRDQAEALFVDLQNG